MGLEAPVGLDMPFRPTGADHDLGFRSVNRCGSCAAAGARRTIVGSRNRHPQAVVGLEPAVAVAERRQARPDDRPALCLRRGAPLVQREEERRAVRGRGAPAEGPTRTPRRRP